MKLQIHKSSGKTSMEEYEETLLYDFYAFRRFGPAEDISEDEVWPVGTHDEAGNVAFFIYGKEGNINGKDGGFEIKWMTFDERLGKFGGEWFESFVKDSVMKKQDLSKPVVNGNITTYETKYKYVWFSVEFGEDELSPFVVNSFKKLTMAGKTYYLMGR